MPLNEETRPNRTNYCEINSWNKSVHNDNSSSKKSDSNWIFNRNISIWIRIWLYFKFSLLLDVLTYSFYKTMIFKTGQTDGLCKNLNDNKFPWLSRIFLNVLLDLNNAVSLTISIHFWILNSPISFPDWLTLIPGALSIIGITLTFMFHSFFPFLTQSRCLYSFKFSFNFILWSFETMKLTSWQVVFLC